MNRPRGGKPAARRERAGADRETGAAKPGLATRQAAVKLLGAVVDRRTSLDGLLDSEGGNPAYLTLSPADRALVRAILMTTLRQFGTIQAVLGMVLKTPLPEGARSLSHILSVAAAQILHLDVPDSAAVDLAVEQANRDPRSRRFASLVNAVLRRVSREKEALVASAADVPNAPPWFVDLLAAEYGADRMRAILAAHAIEPPVDLTVRENPEAWAGRLGGRVLPTGSVRLDRLGGPVTALDGFAEGAWWVQDAAASIPARLFGDIAGRKLADLCAAPGGKTAQLLLQGAVVTGFDLSANRLKRLSGNLDRLGLSATLVEGDFMRAAQDGAYDAVLLDAPCSSTGTVRRHPDIPWTKGPADIEKLAALQERMLRRATMLVRPGGLLVFSNCSLARAEGEDVVARVLADTPSLARVPVAASRWPGLEAAVTPLGEIRTTPDMLKAGCGAGGIDGFYAVVLRRAEA